MKQRSNYPMNQWITETMNQWTTANRWTNSTNHWPMNQRIRMNQGINKPMSQWINERTNGWINELLSSYYFFVGLLLHGATSSLIYLVSQLLLWAAPYLPHLQFRPNSSLRAVAMRFATGCSGCSGCSGCNPAWQDGGKCGKWGPEPWRHRPYFHNPRSHHTIHTRKNARFHPWIYTLPDSFTSQLLDDVEMMVWLTWWCEC